MSTVNEIAKLDIGAGSGPAAGVERVYLPAVERLTRTGFYSSEFWLVVCAIGLFALDAAAGDLPPKWMAALSTLLVLAYKFFRVTVKMEGAQQIVMLADSLRSAGGELRGAPVAAEPERVTPAEEAGAREEGGR